MTGATISEPVERTLEAREFLQALHMIEAQGMPAGTRCYIVNIDHEGKRTMRAVPTGSSVLNLETDLIDRLHSWMFVSPEYLIKVRDYLTDWLTRAKVDLRNPDDVRREEIVVDAAAELDDIGRALLKTARSPFNADKLMRTMALRVLEIAGITMDAFGEEAEEPEDLAMRLYGTGETSEA